MFVCERERGQTTLLFYSKFKWRKDKYLQASCLNTDSSGCKICRNALRDTHIRFESSMSQESFGITIVPPECLHVSENIFFSSTNMWSMNEYEKACQTSLKGWNVQKFRIWKKKRCSLLHVFFYTVSVNTWSCLAHLTNRGEAAGLQASHTNKTHLFYLLTATLSAHHNNKGTLLAEKNLLIYSSC